MSANRRVVLVVDDEVPFLRTVSDGFTAYSEKVELLTACSGREALFILGGRTVDLVITDLHMPEMDGFELLAAMTRSYPSMPVLVMTAFGTAEIGARLKGVGVEHYLEKPLDFNTLAQRVFQTLSMQASGKVKGITLSSFLQIIALDRKSCQLRISSEDQIGHLSFERGVLVDARTGSLEGDSAGLAIVSWEDADIEILPPRATVSHTVQMQLPMMLIESMRQEDEKRRDDGTSSPSRRPPPPAPSLPRPPLPSVPKEQKRSPAPSPPVGPPPVQVAVAADAPPLGPSPPRPGAKKENHMAAKEKMDELTKIDGFLATAVFSPAGEELAMIPGQVANIREIGVLANNVLMNAQKASLEMGAGRGQMVHVEGEKAHILVRCLNEGTDPLKAQPGRAHIHMVLVLKPESSIGMAKLKIGQVVEKLAEEFR